jgi:phosphoglycerate kinase
MNLPTLQSLQLSGKRILLRLDLDVPVKDGNVLEDARLYASIPTFKYLFENNVAKITVLGHRGRPNGKVDESMSLVPVGKRLHEILIEKLGQEVVSRAPITLEENLRFNLGEEENSLDFARELAQKGDIYINEAFAVCHRDAASIVGLSRLLPHAAGLHLQEEIETLDKVLNNPAEPVVFIISGGKPDKATLIEKLLDHGEYVLVGGIVAKYVKSYCREKDGRMCIVAAQLTPDNKDITPDSVQNFVKIIQAAGTIVWNGPMGDIDNGFWDATKIVTEAVASSSGYKVVGGGDTIHVLEHFNLLDKMDYVSIGGGAMLEFLAFGDLPGLKALRGD